MQTAFVGEIRMRIEIERHWRIKFRWRLLFETVVDSGCIEVIGKLCFVDHSERVNEIARLMLKKGTQLMNIAFHGP
jgi:tRNA1(Val) A37 N6-methylase TrmN6